MAVGATPDLPIGDYIKANSRVVSARPDIIIDDGSSVPVELMESLIFENIGGQELLLLTRYDTVSGQKIAYRPIANTEDIDLKFSPDNLLFASESFKNYFKNFTILLESVVPELLVEDGTATQTKVPLESAPNAYINKLTGGVAIEFKDMRAGYQVEIQSMASSNTFDDTIY